MNICASPSVYSDFVMEILEQADERHDRRCRLKSLGYDISIVEWKVMELFDIEKENLYSGSRKKPISEAWSLFCYWCVRELGESMTSMAKLLGLTQPANGQKQNLCFSCPGVLTFLWDNMKI